MKYLFIVTVTYNLVVSYLIWDKEFNPVKEGTEFNTDYRIDLKQEGYWIADEQGNEAWVELGELEEWLLKDNI